MRLGGSYARAAIIELLKQTFELLPVSGIERPPNGYGLFADAFQIRIAIFNLFKVLPP